MACRTRDDSGIAAVALATPAAALCDKIPAAARHRTQGQDVWMMLSEVTRGEEHLKEESSAFWVNKVNEKRPVDETGT